MKTNYLLSNRFKKIGWLIFIPVFLLSILYLIFEFEIDLLEIKVFALFNGEIFNDNNSSFFTTISNNILNEILGLLIITSSVFIAFSKEKHEDEFISKLRLESLVWATYLNYFILVLALLFVYNIAFYWVLIFNMFTILIFFMIRFNWMIYKSKKALKYEK